jgi:alpha-galactosidase
MKTFGFIAVVILFFLSGCNTRPDSSEKNSATDLEILAPTPPLGWNSYDCYDWRVNEAEFKANVDFMSENLKKHGFEYAVVDYLWHIVDTVGDQPILERTPRARKLKYAENGNLLDQIAIDEFGRVQPDPIRFPSAVEGKGFKALADYTHQKGLKFGIHIMRGIPRIAVHQNLPVYGSSLRAADIGEPYDTCIWENSMFGVNYTAPGAQEYYNSLIELYASWGVDFIKADDIMYPEFHKEEIRMIREAIIKVGHPIVLSLSLGEPQFFEAEFIQDQANMWRISGDFWDDWSQIVRQFDLCNFWANYSRPGSYPDADMLPVGSISLARHKGPARISNLTWPEHYTLLSLWSIARSPLMIGGDLPGSPDSTLLFLTNDEILYVNQHSLNGHRVYQGWADNTIVWLAEDSRSDDLFMALFNVGEVTQEISFNFELEHLRDTYHIRDLWKHEDLGSFTGNFCQTIAPHGAGLYRMKKQSDRI